MSKVSSWGTWVPGSRDLGTAPCAVWFTGPAISSGPSVLVLPPIGYEYASSFRALHDLAVSMAEDGCTVAQLDYPGTGNSAGETESARLDSWRRAATTAATALRGMRMAGALVIVGVRLGGSIALQVAESVDPDAVALVDPVMSGKRFVREQRMLGVPDPDGLGGLAVGGYHLPAQLINDVLDLAVELPRARRVQLVVPDETAVPTTHPLVERMVLRGLPDFLARPAEEAVTDPVFTRALTTWVSRQPPAPQGETHVPDVGPHMMSMRWNDADLAESYVSLGPHGLPGILTEPPDGRAKGVVLLINSGSDPHIGPGRAWVELGRHLAVDCGWAAVRFDSRGWGRAPRGPDGGGRPYDRSMETDIADAVADLRARGQCRIVLAGLCAGAWMALKVACESDVEGVVALNVQMYWHYGDPVEALIADTSARRADEIQAIAAAEASGRWDAEDDAGIRPAAGLWLDALAERHMRVEMIFAEGDPGLDYLRTRLRKRLDAALRTGHVSITEVAELDHTMQKVWLRPRVFAAFSQALDRIEGVELGRSERPGSGPR